MSSHLLAPGDRFNPTQIFIGSFIPNVLMRYPGLSDGAKLAWARLGQYAGHNGVCYPALSTLANELGKSKRQVQRVLSELEEQGFIEREAPDQEAKGRRQTTRYYFTWHAIFADSATRVTSDPSPQTPRDTSVPSPRDKNVTPLGTNVSPKENQRKNKEKTTTTWSLPEQSLEPSGESCDGGSLSADQERVIELTVQRAQAEGKITSSPGALRRSLKAKALAGDLDTSDLSFLEEWADRRQAIKEQTEKRKAHEKRKMEEQRHQTGRKERLLSKVRAVIEASDDQPEVWRERIVKNRVKSIKCLGIGITVNGVLGLGLHPGSEVAYFYELYPHLSDGQWTYSRDYKFD